MNTELQLWPAVIDVGKGGGEKRALGEKGLVEFLTSNDLEQCVHLCDFSPE